MVIVAIHGSFMTSSRIPTLDSKTSETFAADCVKKRVRNHSLDQKVKASRTHCY